MGRMGDHGDAIRVFGRRIVLGKRFLSMIEQPNVGRLAYRRDGGVCPATPGAPPSGTGAQR